MHFFKALYSPFSLALIGYASSNQKYSTWMLESIISRGEGVGAADGLLGGIQKVHIEASCLVKAPANIPVLSQCKKGLLSRGSSCGCGKHK